MYPQLRHTPGPWEVVGFSDGLYYIRQRPDAPVIASIHFAGLQEGQTFGNAVLISSAPELLRHLEHLAGACERFAPHIMTTEARAAIKKATCIE